VAGAGVFGGYHARKYASLPGVKLAAIYDRHLDRAEALAGEFGAEAFDGIDAFLAAVNVVTVATPADSHAALARLALEAGKPAYVEKPLADTLAEANSLVGLARERGLTLACGHQERVVFAAMGLLAVPEAALGIEAVRRGTPNPRNRDVSCVLDLMVHDLDLGLKLTGGEPSSIHAQGEFDAVRAELRFPHGMVAIFEASRIAERRERTMRIVYPSGEVEIDFLAPSFRNTTPFALNRDFAETPQGRDPLGASVSGFLAAVQGKAPRPTVTAEEGARALALGLAIEQAAGLGRTSHAGGAGIRR
jgi:predicted dehydrogenase